jgi:hypothetical protein
MSLSAWHPVPVLPQFSGPTPATAVATFASCMGAIESFAWHSAHPRFFHFEATCFTAGSRVSLWHSPQVTDVPYGLSLATCTSVWAAFRSREWQSEHFAFALPSTAVRTSCAMSVPIAVCDVSR